MDNTDTVVAVFNDHPAAEAAVKQLAEAGFAMKQLSIMLGAALFSLGIPKDSVLRYEAAIKADSFLVMAHGTAEDVARAQAILGTAKPARIDVHGARQVATPDVIALGAA